MPRIQFSDVTPPEGKRSIRNIPIPNSGKRRVPVSVPPEIKPAPKPEVDDSGRRDSESEIKIERENKAYEYYYPKDKPAPAQYVSGSGKTGRKKWVFGTITALVIAGFVVGMMTVFASANIDIVPKSQDIAVDMKISATTEKATSTVRYEVIKLSKSKTVSVPATGEEAAEVKASGKIVIYNNFSSDPQRLITRTRFESPDGLIYRISESVVVPGKSTKSGVETPGSLEVTVFADEAGDKYNIKKTDFTIPGFKNDAARFKNIYARSSTDMAGGFVGKRKTVLPADKQTALASIDSGVQADMQRDLASKVPDGLTLLSGSIIYKSNELPAKENVSSVDIGKEITAYAVMLNTQDLSDAITNQYVSKLPEWSNIKPVIKNFSLLNVGNVPGDPESGNKIDLQISGKAKAWADIDTNIINQRLLGAPKGAVSNLMADFAGISSITATIRPVWKQSFPENPLKIHVQTVTNE